MFLTMYTAAEHLALRWERPDDGSPHKLRSTIHLAEGVGILHCMVEEAGSAEASGWVGRREGAHVVGINSPKGLSTDAAKEWCQKAARSIAGLPAGLHAAFWSVAPGTRRTAPEVSELCAALKATTTAEEES
jgi:hypothetical protein